MNELILYSNDEFYDYILHYICSEEELSKNVNSFRYLSESNLRPYEYRPRYRKKENKEKKVKICALEDTSFDFELNNEKIHFILETIMENSTPKLISTVTENCCGTSEQILFKKLTLKSKNKQNLLDFVDKGSNYLVQVL